LDRVPSPKVRAGKRQVGIPSRVLLLLEAWEHWRRGQPRPIRVRLLIEKRIPESELRNSNLSDAVILNIRPDRYSAGSGSFSSSGRQ
jgi:hypothetical protein